jgi:hypothetical protein
MSLSDSRTLRPGVLVLEGVDMIPCRSQSCDVCDVQDERLLRYFTFSVSAFVKKIPDQYRDIDKSRPITTVLMDGGGNDMFYTLNCYWDHDACKAKIEETVVLLEQLYQQIHADGVGHVIQLVGGYDYAPWVLPVRPGSGGASVGLGVWPCLHSRPCRDQGYYYMPLVDNEIIDYGSDRAAAVCAAAPVECHFVDPRYRFDSSGHLAWDQIHPLPEGQQTLAELIWEVKLQFNVPL